MYKGAVMKARRLSTGNIMLPPARMIYPRLITAGLPKDKTDEKDRQWGATFLMLPTADLSVLEEEFQRIINEKKLPRNCRTGILDTDSTQSTEKFANEYPRMIRASRHAYTKQGEAMEAPGVLYADAQTPVEPDQEGAQCYGGRWARATVQAFAYDAGGNRGISLGLVNVQLLKHDEKIGGGRARAEDEFDAMDMDEDDAVRAAAANDALGEFI